MVFFGLKVFMALLSHNEWSALTAWCPKGTAAGDLPAFTLCAGVVCEEERVGFKVTNSDE